MTPPIRSERLARALPKSITVLAQGYDPGRFLRDLLAGLTVGIVALPLAMAFAIASGTTPEKGLFTAMVGGFLISLLGGSRYQIGGPTGAFVVIIFNVLFKHGYDGLVITTLIAGCLLLVFGLCRLGTLIKYIPYPVTTGFTAGIAVLIFSSQMKDFFGLAIASPSPEFLEKWAAYLGNWQSFQGSTLLVSALAFLVILAVRRFIPRIPAPVAGVLVASAAAWALGLHTETIGTRFGGIPSVLPTFSLPTITLARVRELFPDAVTVALLAGIESLLSCVVADGMSGDRHASNVELTAQGIANIASVSLGGIPATGAIARTATNIRAGAYSPMAGMIHALVLAAFVLFLAPLASHIALGSLAAVLVVVSWDMSEIHKFIRLLRAPKSDVAVMLLTFGLTVLVDLTVAVWVGVVLASLLFMRRMSEATRITSCTLTADTRGPGGDVRTLPIPDGVQVYEIDGPFFFGVAERFHFTLRALQEEPKVFILRMRKVLTIDSTAINALEALIGRCRKQGALVLFTGVRDQVFDKMARMGTVDLVGGEAFHTDLTEALAAARARLEELRGTPPQDSGHTPVTRSLQPL